MQNSLFFKSIHLAVVWTFVIGYCCDPAWALPSTPSVVSGEADVSVDGSGNMTINASDEAILEFEIFSIGADEAVHFIQPSPDASVLSRVTGQQASDIAGDLHADGRLILINPYGIIFRQTANVHAASLIASTLDIQNAHYLSDQLLFEKIAGSVEGKILNEGRIEVMKGGHVVLLSEVVTNDGVIIAAKGSIVLASGERASVSFDPAGLVNLVIGRGTDGKTQTLTNTGEVLTDGGRVIFNSQSLNATMDTLINNEGIVEADAIVERNGKVEFVSNGAVEHSGKIRADVFDEKGYTFRSSGDIEGGDAYYDNLDGAATLLSGSYGSNQSDTGDLTVNGDITLSADVIFAADSDNNGNGAFAMAPGTQIDGNGNDLTLRSAANNEAGAAADSDLYGLTDIDVLTVEDAGGANTPTYVQNDSVDVDDFVLESGNFTSPVTESFSAASDFQLNGGTFTRFGGSGTGGDPYTVTDVYGLQAVSDHVDKTFEIANDIDASATSGWNAGKGFIPIAETPAGGFTGTLDGNDNTISDLFIDHSATEYWTGMIGYLKGAVQDLNLQNADVRGDTYVGALAGGSQGTIANCTASGSVQGELIVGGLLGINYNTVQDSGSSVEVTPLNMSIFEGGGLVGENTWVVQDSYATGSVTGTTEIGGLVGKNDAYIRRSYATGDVSGNSGVGGLAGYSSLGIEDSYATGDVLGNSQVGGLLGYNLTGYVFDSYATGGVSGSSRVGGLVGENSGHFWWAEEAAIRRSFSTGGVSGATNTGGFVGFDDKGQYIDNYWNISDNASLSDAGNSGDMADITSQTIDQMRQEDTFSGFDFASNWEIIENVTFPYKPWQTIILPGVSNPPPTSQVPDPIQYYNPWTGYGLSEGGWGILDLKADADQAAPQSDDRRKKKKSELDAAAQESAAAEKTAGIKPDLKPQEIEGDDKSSTEVFVHEGTVYVNDHTIYDGEKIRVEPGGQTKLSMREVFVANGDGVDVMRAKIHTPLKSLPGANRVAAMASSPDGTQVFTVSDGESDLNAVDTGSFGSRKVISGLPGGASDVKLSKDGRTGFVVDRFADVVSVVDLASGQVVRTLTTGTMPTQACLAPDENSLFVTNGLDGTVSKINTKTNAEESVASITGTPAGIALSADGEELFVTDAAGGRLVILDAADMKEKGSIPAGHVPHDVKVTPDGHWIFVSGRGNDSVTMIDATTKQVVRNIPVGRRPARIAVTPEGHQAYVANTLSGSVTLIDVPGQAAIEHLPAGPAPTNVVISTPQR